MIGTLAWKDYREQRPIWLAMAVLSAGLMAGLLAALSPAGAVLEGSDKHDMLLFGAHVLAGIYGLVCGCMLLAGEHESRTQDFLDTQTADRARLWWTKLLTGLALTAAFGVFQTAVVSAVRVPIAPSLGWLQAGVWLATLTAAGFVPLGWGMLFSARCRSVLVAAGLAALVVPPVLLVGELAVASVVRSGTEAAVAYVVVEGSLAALAAVASGCLYERPDAARRAALGPTEGSVGVGARLRRDGSNLFGWPGARGGGSRSASFSAPPLSRCY